MELDPIEEIPIFLQKEKKVATRNPYKPEITDTQEKNENAPNLLL